MMGAQPSLTLFDVASSYLARQSDGSREGRIAFMLDDAQRESAAMEEPVGALALAICEELYQEAVRDGWSPDDVEAFKAELVRRAREPDAVERLRQHLLRMLN